jgi:hypothetical protein
VTIQPAGGGPTTTVASGSGTPPSTLATLDPTGLDSGTDAITINATGAGGTVARTEYLNITTAPGADIAPPPSLTTGTAGGTFTQGQPISLSLTVTNTSQTACQLSTSDSALQISSVSVNGQAESPQQFPLDVYQTTDSSGSYSWVPAGGSISISLSADSAILDPNGVALGTVDESDEIATEWPLDAVGQYEVQLEYSADTVPGGTDPCPGTSNSGTIDFSIAASNTTAGIVRLDTLRVAANVNRPSPCLRDYGSLQCQIPVWLQQINRNDTDLNSQLNQCFKVWGPTGTGLGDQDGHVISDLDRYINGANPVAGGNYVITLLRLNQAPIEIQKQGDNTIVGNSGSIISWDPDPDSTYNQSDGINTCQSIYHELAHVRNAMDYAAYHSAPGAPSLTLWDAAWTLKWSKDPSFRNGIIVEGTGTPQPCYANLEPDFSSDISVSEARAIQAENDFRSFEWDDFRNSHDTQGREKVPLDSYYPSPPACADPPYHPAPVRPPSALR